MKFGHLLNCEKEASWATEYLSYKGLKKIIFESDDSERLHKFRLTFLTCLLRVNHHTDCVAAEFLQEVDAENTGRRRSHVHDLRGLGTKLVRYVDFNSEGFRKILKKYVKHFPSEGQVLLAEDLWVPQKVDFCLKGEEVRKALATMDGVSVERSFYVNEPYQPSENDDIPGDRAPNTVHQTTSSTSSTASWKLGNRQTCGREVRNDIRDSGMRMRVATISVLSMLGLLLAIAAMAEPGAEPGTRATLPSVEILYFVVTFLTALVCLLIVELYIFGWRMTQEDCKTLNVESAPYWRKNMMLLLLEVAVHIPHPIWWDGWGLLSLYGISLMFLRGYTVLRAVGHILPAYSRRFHIFGNKYPNLRIGWVMVFKMHFLQHPFLYFLILSLYVTLWGSFIVWVAERSSLSEGNNFKSFHGTLYFVIITSLTANGAVDGIPSTTLGAAAASSVALLGVVIANMASIILFAKFSASSTESQVMNHMLQHSHNGKLKSASARIIALAFRFRKVTKPAIFTGHGTSPSSSLTLHRGEAQTELYQKLRTAIAWARAERAALANLGHDAHDTVKLSSHVVNILKKVEEIKAELGEKKGKLAISPLLPNASLSTYKQATSESRGGQSRIGREKPASDDGEPKVGGIPQKYRQLSRRVEALELSVADIATSLERQTVTAAEQTLLLKMILERLRASSSSDGGDFPPKG